MPGSISMPEGGRGSGLVDGGSERVGVGLRS